MRARILALVCGACIVLPASRAAAQSVTSEATVTAGASTDQVTAGATQARLFGSVGWLRYYAEAAWAAVDGPAGDVFGTAYPYQRTLQPIEVYGERMFRRGPAVAAVRAGRFRTPFGISSGSDHAYAGFLRSPMIRYPGYWALSYTFLEHGVDAMVGTGSVQLEVATGVPGDVGIQHRRSGQDVAVRAQAYHGSWVAGVSHVRTQPYQPASYAKGRAVFSGVDARWMRGGVQLRGEWLTGRPFNGTRTTGGYVDTFLHLRPMGPLTAVMRVERLDYEAGARSRAAARLTAGARIKLLQGLYAQVNANRQTGRRYAARRGALDAAVTYTVRYGR